MHVILEHFSRNMTCHNSNPYVRLFVFERKRPCCFRLYLPIWLHFHLIGEGTPSFQSLSGISRTDLGSLDRGGPKFTQYNVETVFQLITSTSRQFSVTVNAYIWLLLLRLISVNLLKERGYRLSRRHISESRCLCKRGTASRAELTIRGKSKEMQIRTTRLFS